VQLTDLLCAKAGEWSGGKVIAVSGALGRGRACGHDAGFGGSLVIWFAGGWSGEAGGFAEGFESVGGPGPAGRLCTPILRQLAPPRASLVMRSAHLQTLDVQPVVVVWGRWQGELQDGARVVDGVLKGLHLRTWLNERPVGTTSSTYDDEVLAKLRSFKARVDPTRPR
jgi:hypothetical protein